MIPILIPCLQSLNNVLYSNDPKEIPLTDIDAAASLPYDTDIPEGNVCVKEILIISFTCLENADIPDDPAVAFEQNAMKITRINAVAQVKSMVDLVDEIAANALKSMVAGEELNTKAPLGVSMKMAK